MSQRFLARSCSALPVALCLAALIASPRRAAGFDTSQTARANDPATLSAPSQAPPSTSDAATATPPPPVEPPRPPVDEVAPVADAEVPANADPAPLDAFEAPAREARPLGEASTRGTGVAEIAADESAGASSWLPAWLDLREHEAARVGGSLLAVIGLIVLTCVMMRRRTGGSMSGGGRPSGVLEVLARYPVGRGQSMVLLKLGRRVLLMHQAGQAMTTLSEIHDRDEVADLLGRLEAGAGGRASGWFRTLLRRYEAEHAQAAQRPALAAGSSRASSRNDEVIDLTRGRRRPSGRVRQRSIGS
ncbi:MAG: FliO/MopB family protein [Planctomycetota bacterium]|jgi:flagellar biogenesis protein FliO